MGAGARCGRSGASDSPQSASTAALADLATIRTEGLALSCWHGARAIRREEEVAEEGLATVRMCGRVIREDAG